METTSSKIKMLLVGIVFGYILSPAAAQAQAFSRFEEHIVKSLDSIADSLKSIERKIK